MYTDTLNTIISYLALWEQFTNQLDKGRVSRHKNIGITLLYIGF